MRAPGWRRVERKCAGASGSRAAFSPHSSGGRLLSLRGFSSLETCPQLVPTHAQPQTEARSQPPLTGEYRLSARVARGAPMPPLPATRSLPPCHRPPVAPRRSRSTRPRQSRRHTAHSVSRSRTARLTVPGDRRQPRSQARNRPPRAFQFAALRNLRRNVDSTSGHRRRRRPLGSRSSPHALREGRQCPRPRKGAPSTSCFAADRKLTSRFARSLHRTRTPLLEVRNSFTGGTSSSAPGLPADQNARGSSHPAAAHSGNSTSKGLRLDVVRTRSSSRVPIFSLQRLPRASTERVPRSVNGNRIFLRTDGSSRS